MYVYKVSQRVSLIML